MKEKFGKQAKKGWRSKVPRRRQTEVYHVASSAHVRRDDVETNADKTNF